MTAAAQSNMTTVLGAGWARRSPAVRAEMMRNGRSPSEMFLLRFTDGLANQAARYRMKDIFRNSAGWKVTGPRVNQRLAPLAVTPSLVKIKVSRKRFARRNGREILR